MSVEEKLTEILNLPVELEPEEDEEIVAIPTEQKEEKKSSDLEKDYKYNRRVLRQLLKDSQEQLKTLMELASATEQPRAYEVMTTLISTIADTTQKLMNLQKVHREMQGNAGGSVTNQIENTTNTTNVFFGSAAELQKAMKSIKENELLEAEHVTQSKEIVDES